MCVRVGRGSEVRAQVGERSCVHRGRKVPARQEDEDEGVRRRRSMWYMHVRQYSRANAGGQAVRIGRARTG